MSRSDPSGEFAQIVLGVVSQYVGDVIGNVIDGKKGWDILKPTSSIGDYVAAGVTALIPGSKFVASIARAGITTAINSAEAHFNGQEFSAITASSNFLKELAGDYISGKAIERVSRIANKLMPVNYSQYAHTQRVKNPGANYSKAQLSKKLSNTIRGINRANEAAIFTINSFSAAFTR